MTGNTRMLVTKVYMGTALFSTGVNSSRGVQSFDFEDKRHNHTIPNIARFNRNTGITVCCVGKTRGKSKG